ncbi:hypothetical protein CWC46_04395 [Prodigiosinella confusarubida]|uniref:Cas12f1-like TNB domain-containing protein n=1 Tax=Serratia sp. (strain ATCC 39006) TaxID=104623 RepID=A0A2I5T3M0_SERS3|nr:hypothetical protein CWC46_04395 [Serratia sp. ATCC 39006]AUH03437.1 hypothetical protein Ser39006_004395 [Serratia sp. ATCC 39006]
MPQLLNGFGPQFQAGVGLDEFFRQLDFKCAWRGVRLLKVGRWGPSSKRCSSCGEINVDLTLAMGTWTCPSCGSGHIRSYKGFTESLCSISCFGAPDIALPEHTV